MRFHFGFLVGALVTGCQAAPSSADSAAALVAQLESGTIFSAAGPCSDITSATAADGHVEVFARSVADGSLWRFWESGANGSYAGAAAQRLTVSAVGAPVEATERAPTVALSHADGQLHVFYLRASSGELMEVSGSGVGAWSYNAVSHGASFHDPAVLEVAGNQLALFATDGTGQTVQRYQTSAGGAWSAWSSTAVLPSRTTGKSAVVQTPSDGAIWIFDRDQSGAIWFTKEPALGGGFAPFMSLHGTMQFPAIAAVDTSGVINLAAVGSDGTIYRNLLDERYVQDPSAADFGGWTVFLNGSFSLAADARNSAPHFGAYADGRLEMFFNNGRRSGAGSFWSMSQCAIGTWTGMQPGIKIDGGAWSAAADASVSAEADGRLVGFSLDRSGILRWARAKKPSVSVANGDLVGRYQCAASVYKGVPFAQPPLPVSATVSRRFAPPEPLAGSWGTRDAGNWANICPQVARDAANQPHYVGNEDCLYLNVFAPSKPVTPLPIMFFIHGGGNYSGSAIEFDGATLVNRANQLGTPVIVVTTQYRLGALGYLAYPGLTNGNNGLRDQQAALKWVHQNIARFGGDPKRVMIFGESGGAANVEELMASPLSAGLFWAAAMESGAGTVHAIATLAQAEAASQKLVTTVGCDQNCLVGSPADQAVVQSLVLTATAMRKDGNIADAYITKDEDGIVIPYDLLTSLRFYASVPAIVGANRDESSAPDISANPNMILSATDYTSYVSGFGSASAQILGLYPAQPNSMCQEIALDSDVNTICATREAARFLGGLNQPVYRYFFTHTLQDPNSLIDPVNPIGVLGAYHGAELSFVFASLGQPIGWAQPYRATAAEEGLSSTMVLYWTRFAATRNPNGLGTPTWPAYSGWSPTHDPVMQLDTPSRVTTVDSIPRCGVSGMDSQRCDFWLTQN